MKITEKYHSSSGPTFLSDFSPPRGPDKSVIEDASKLPVDFICVAHSPGRAVRSDSAMLAHAIKHNTGKDVIFNLTTRDMNKLGLQTHIIGAQLLGLENVVVMQGEEFSEKDQLAVSRVNGFTTTSLIKSINQLNQGIDFRGTKLHTSTDICIGGTIDLSNDLPTEILLTQKKVTAGVDFVITQPIFDATLPSKFLEEYETLTGVPLSIPVFYAIQVLKKHSVTFSSVPKTILSDLDNGRSGSDIALDLLHELLNTGLRGIHIIPPILKGGLRDYDTAAEVVTRLSA